jgi:hypothetical protein
MSLFRGSGSQQTHHHSLLAGVSAGAMAVLVVFALVLLAWHRVSGAVGDAVIVIVWAVAVSVASAGVAGAVYVVLWLRHRIRHPEALARRPAATATVLDQPAAQPELAAQPVAELPAGGSHTHYHFDSAEAVGAALQAMQERQITEDPS